LLCSVNVSTCLRACSVQSSTNAVGTDDQPLRKASNIHNATAATARRMIKLVLMSRLTLKIQAIGVCRPPS
jgi:hypothetical protein